MFCPKCGAKALDGAGFCQKCGAKLIEEASVQPAASDSANAIQSSGEIPAAVPKKKKSKKLFIILVIVFAFIVILIIENVDDWAESGKEYERQEEYIKSQQASADVDLSETYTNKEEGISFKYPSAWVPVSEDEFVSRFGEVEGEESPLVFLANEIEDLPEENTYIMVSRFDATQDMVDHLFIDDDQFASTFDDDVTVENTSVMEIDGVAARKITYLDKDGIGYQSYFYAAGSGLYRIDFSYKGKSAGNTQRFFDAVIGSYKITAAETTVTGKSDSSVADKLLYNGIPVDTIMEMKAEDVVDAFGTPDEYSDENFVQILSEDGEYLVAMANFDNTGYVSYFAGDLEKYEMNGQNLNHDYDKLVEIFGREPDSQEVFDLQEVKWFYDGYSILIGLDTDGLPGKVEVWKNGDGGNDAAVASNLPDGFIWVEEPTGKTDEWSTTITGIIQNVSGQDCSFVDISFNLYDSSGNQVGTAYTHINNLKAGGTWKFQAVDFVYAPRFEFSAVDYY